MASSSPSEREAERLRAVGLSEDAARPWWSRWPAVLTWFVLGVLAIIPPVLGWLVYAFLTVDNTAGIDMTVESATPPAFLRVLAVVAAVASLPLPFFVARWARKMWLGYVLLGAVITLFVLLIGLFMFQVL